VDSFGLGMTAYFLLSKSDPTINAHIRPTWESDLKLLAMQQKCKEWQSLPARMIRLILESTKHQQNYRLSFSQIVAGIQALSDAIEEPENVIDPPMIAEEIFARTEMLTDYVMKDGWPSYQGLSGLTVEAKPLVIRSGFRIVFHFMQRGHEKYQDLFAIGESFKLIHTKFQNEHLSDKSCKISHGDFMTSLDFEVQRGGMLVKMLPKDLSVTLDKLAGLIAHQ